MLSEMKKLVVKNPRLSAQQQGSPPLPPQRLGPDHPAQAEHHLQPAEPPRRKEAVPLSRHEGEEAGLCEETR